jgi:hypothetical protein
MIRREFITLLGGAAAWPLAAHAQPTRDVRRIAVLMGTATNDLGRSYLATFTQRLEQLGWSNGRSAVSKSAGGPARLSRCGPSLRNCLRYRPT